MATNSNTQNLAMLFNTTGERLEALRKEKGYTQGDLAELLGTTKATISRYESNLIDIPRPKLQKLADFLGVSPAFLLCWDQQEEIAETRIKEPEVFSGVSRPIRINYEGLESLSFGQPYQTAKEQENEDRQEKELLKIFRSLSMRGQTKLLSAAYELQESEQPLSFENLTGPKPLMTAEELTTFIKQITADPGPQNEISEQEQKRVDEIIERAKERIRKRETEKEKK